MMVEICKGNEMPKTPRAAAPFSNAVAIKGWVVLTGQMPINRTAPISKGIDTSQGGANLHRATRQATLEPVGEARQNSVVRV